MLSQEEVRALHRVRFMRQQPGERLLHGSVTRGIARALGSEPETQRHVKTIGGHGRERDAGAEEQDLVDSRIAMVGKRLSALRAAGAALSARRRSPPNSSITIRAVSFRRDARSSGTMPPAFSAVASAESVAASTVSGASPTAARNASNPRRQLSREGG